MLVETIKLKEHLGKLGAAISGHMDCDLKAVLSMALEMCRSVGWAQQLWFLVTCKGRVIP
jgi:hypothetical protein